MTVGELMALLDEFPRDLPVYFTPDAAGRRVAAPAGAGPAKVHPGRGVVLDDDDPHRTVPPGYLDAVVIRPRPVGDER